MLKNIPLITLIILSFAAQVGATHIMGGNLELKALKNTGNYSIILKVYIDLTGATDAESDQFVGIYRKKDDGEMKMYNLPRISTKLVVYENETCSEKRKLKTLFVYYAIDVALNPSEYNDPDGYYLMWTNCCRNGSIVNLKEPTKTTTLLRTFFPPLIRNGKVYINSTPTFQEIDGAYICYGDPFYFPFQATDSDNDDLHYSLTNPGGYNSVTGNGPQWQTGYSASNAIPGFTPLQINPKTGQLFVVPNQLGLFVFSVLVQERRNGELIGSAQRDYQLFVVDCPPVSPPKATILLNGQNVTETSICEGIPAHLTSKDDPGWNYQWKKDGKNLEGANKSSLTASESGEYMLVTSLASTCSKSSTSNAVKLNITKSNFKLKTKKTPAICTSNGRLILNALKNPDYTYQWYKDESAVVNSSDSLIATKPGRYRVTISDKSTGCTSLSDTVQVINVANPLVSLASDKALTSLCQGDSILLKSTYNANYQYTWTLDSQTLKNAKNSYYASKPGKYMVTVKDSMDCEGTSEIVEITSATEVSATLDSIAPMCGTNHLPIKMHGFPAGGVFSGKGIEGNTFDPQKAGTGAHDVTYRIQGNMSCPGQTASRTILIHKLPMANTGPNVSIQEGGSVHIGNPPAAGHSYSWTPGDGLDNPFSSRPLASPKQHTIYTLRITDMNGCFNEGQVSVKIFNLVYIPDIFTPDGDGINDNWELVGIQHYPNAKITIFNRWGSVIFHSEGYKQPFDGRFKGIMQSAGVYIYSIQLDETLSRQGSFMLLR